MYFQMFALVEFLENKSKDGTTPCEIIHFSWLNTEQTQCDWPGNTRYFSAFKNTAKPGPKWKKYSVIVKFVSNDLQEVRRKRDVFIFQSEIESSVDEGKRAETNKPMNTLGNSTVDSSSSEIESSPEVCRKNIKATGNLPSAPSIAVPSTSSSTSMIPHFEYINSEPLHVRDIQNESQTKSSEGGLGTAEMQNITLEIQKEILKKVRILISKVDQLALDVRSLKATTTVDVAEGITDCPKLPIESEDQLKQFELFLIQDGSLEHLSAILSKVGGTSIKEATERILARIFTDCFASLYNWKGTQYKNRPTKYPFHIYKRIINLVICSVRKTSGGKGTDKEIEEAIKYWLKHAKGRIRGEKNLDLMLDVHEGD